MRFAVLENGHFLWLVLGMAVFFIGARNYRKRRMLKFAGEEVLGELSLTYSGRRDKFKKILLLCAVFFLVISLMRPQWGSRWQDVKRKGVDIIIALDVSKSMLAQDVRPNRLEKAKLAVKELVYKLQGDRIGLITFAGSAFTQCPLTSDYSGFLFTLDEVDTDIIPQPGTAISKAITEAVKDYEGGGKKYKALIIITDGEDHQGDILKLAQRAKEENIKIFCIGIGSKEGELIPLVENGGGFLKDRGGNVVKTRLNEDVLKEIARNTGGSYARAGKLDFGLDFIYDQNISKMEKQEFESKMVKYYDQRFQIPLFLAIVLLIAEFLVTNRKKEC